jgi:hypothetical protein
LRRFCNIGEKWPNEFGALVELYWLEKEEKLESLQCHFVLNQLMTVTMAHCP